MLLVVHNALFLAKIPLFGQIFGRIYPAELRGFVRRALYLLRKPLVVSGGPFVVQ